MDTGIRVFVAGTGTMVGAALLRQLEREGLAGLGVDEPDLRDPGTVDRWFAAERPDWVFVCAGAQAGIGGNRLCPADLMVDNLLIAASVIPAAWRHGTARLLYLGSSCIYPKLAPQPFHTDALWAGPVEPTSAAYATAKLAGVRLAEAYRQQYGAQFFSAIAADVYGPGDDFSEDHSHVAAALLRRMHRAKIAGAPTVDVWGSGAARREFIYADDLASACLFVMRHYEDAAPINLGTGTTTSIAELAGVVRDVVGYTGVLRFDTSKPDGMPLKGLDSSRLRAMGWQPAVTLSVGLDRTYRWYEHHVGPEDQRI